MPAPEPLTPSQLASLETRLEEREAALAREVRALHAEAAETPTRQPHEQVGDAGEQGEERIRGALRYAEHERDVLELRQIADARERMQNGSYGWCAACGEPIPLARLEAQPFSERCVACQEKFEATHPIGVRIPAP